MLDVLHSRIDEVQLARFSRRCSSKHHRDGERAIGRRVSEEKSLREKLRIVVRVLNDLFCYHSE